MIEIDKIIRYCVIGNFGFDKTSPNHVKGCGQLQSFPVLWM